MERLDVGFGKLASAVPSSERPSPHKPQSRLAARLLWLQFAVATVACASPAKGFQEWVGAVPNVAVASLVAVAVAVPMADAAPANSIAPSAIEPASAAAGKGDGAAGTLADSQAQSPGETRTRHATYRRASFVELPGWDEDDLSEGWPAFQRSCAALRRRPTWREVCAESASVDRSSGAIREFFASRFELLRILNTDASRDGEITGYFEPLLEGRLQAEGSFSVPVLGVPRDLYTLDWMTVPKDLRRGVVQVRPQGTSLVVRPIAEPGSAPLDLRRFVLDTKDRRLRIRFSRDGEAFRAEPYPTRGELMALGLPAGVDAPVLAWVNDALALYAMQVQGSGRIRLADSTVLRVQYADQNGHPFRPLRVVTKNRARDGVVTRSLGGVTSDVDQFELEGDDTGGVAVPSQIASDAPATGTVAAEEGNDDIVTRGLTNRRSSSSMSSQQAAADALVEELLGTAQKRVPPDRPRPAVTAPIQTTEPLRPRPAGTSSGVPEPTRPAVSPGRLAADPSYVFFKMASDQALVAGPPGALGVPLTPGRSVAVDPRVTPLGYPVFLSASAPEGSRIDMKRLVFAQDTGGAIRGAVRADFFWGFGADAGRLARGTRHRGQMWLMIPKSEVARLGGDGIVTRGLSAPGQRNLECLVSDEQFCQEPE